MSDSDDVGLRSPRRSKNVFFFFFAKEGYEYLFRSTSQDMTHATMEVYLENHLQKRASYEFDTF